MTSNDKLDVLIARALQHDGKTEAEATSRILAALKPPLPPQRGRWWRWPIALLEVDLSPAWPRIAAFGCVAALGLAIGLTAPELSQLDGVTIASAATDFELGVFEPDMLTGVRP